MPLALSSVFVRIQGYAVSLYFKQAFQMLDIFFLVYWRFILNTYTAAHLKRYKPEWLTIIVLPLKKPLGIKAAKEKEKQKPGLSASDAFNFTIVGSSLTLSQCFWGKDNSYGKPRE